MRVIPEFSLEVVPWLRISSAPRVFWPAARAPLHYRLPVPVGHGGGAGPGDGGGGDSGSDDDGGPVFVPEPVPVEVDDGEGDAFDDDAWWAEFENPAPPPPLPAPEGPPPDVAEPEPPPPVPPVPVAAPRYLHYDIRDPAGRDIGYLLFNENAGQIDCHCNIHGPDCAIGRSIVPYDDSGNVTARRAAKGRPQAFLVAWCRLGRQYGEGLAGREGHMNAAKSKDAISRCLADGRSIERVSARAYVEGEASLAPLRLRERQPRIGEPPEPPGPF